jgi:hypothetical protein
MGLEDVEGIERAKKIMTGLRELTEAREICVPDAIKSITSIHKEYDALKKEKGTEFCNEYCPEAFNIIQRVYHELNSGVLE